MKSLIIKDFYNTMHTVRSLLIMLLIIAGLFYPSVGVTGCIVMSGVYCSLLVVSILSMDEHCNWHKYALVMPINRKQIVAAKFWLMIILAFMGVFVGIIISVAGEFITKGGMGIEQFFELLITALTVFAGVMAVGGLTILLVFKFGAERARLLMLLAMAVPVLLIVAVSMLLGKLGILPTDEAIVTLILISPVIAAGFNMLMYKITCNVFAKQEL